MKVVFLKTYWRHQEKYARRRPRLLLVHTKKILLGQCLAQNATLYHSKILHNESFLVLTPKSSCFHLVVGFIHVCHQNDCVFS